MKLVALTSQYLHSFTCILPSDRKVTKVVKDKGIDLDRNKTTRILQPGKEMSGRKCP